MTVLFFCCRYQNAVQASTATPVIPVQDPFIILAMDMERYSNMCPLYISQWEKLMEM